MDSDLAQLTSDRLEIGDALHRFAFGLDHNDPATLTSALTEDCSLDFTPAGAKLGLNFPKLNGLENVVKSLVSLLGPLDTSHTVSNVRIKSKGGDSATVSAYVMAQHFMPGDGPRRGTENALLMNRYYCDAVRDGEQWRLTRVKIDNAWALGDPQILNALASHRAITTKAKSSS